MRSDAQAAAGTPARPAAGDPDIGLLLETVHAQQQQVDAALSRLDAHTHDLDAILRDAVRAVLVEELQAWGDAGRHAADVLRSAYRAASLRAAIWSFCLVAAGTVVPLSLSWLLLPSRTQLQQLRQKRDELTLAVDSLARQGGRIDLRRCGEGSRLCVRVDRKAPAYGAGGDYRVVEGY